jgi:hypothetical protein
MFSTTTPDSGPEDKTALVASIIEPHTIYEPKMHWERAQDDEPRPCERFHMGVVDNRIKTCLRKYPASSVQIMDDSQFGYYIHNLHQKRERRLGKKKKKKKKGSAS